MCVCASECVRVSERASESVCVSSHLYLYSTFNNTNCNKATAQYQNIHNNAICNRPAQFSLNSICAIKSVISLEIKCPQLSKPEEPKLHR